MGAFGVFLGIAVAMLLLGGPSDRAANPKSGGGIGLVASIMALLIITGMGH